MEAVNPHRLLVEHLDSHGNVVAREVVSLVNGQSSLIVGRSVASDIVLNDDFVAPKHASISIADDGSMTLDDLGSVNGVVISGKRLKAANGVRLAANEVQLGRSRLRLRSSRQEVPPEKTDAPKWYARPVFLTLIGSIIAVAQAVYEAWLGAPKDLISDLASGVGITLAVVLVWVAVWAFFSRILSGEWRWLTHAAIFLLIGGIFSIANDAADIAGFMLATTIWDKVVAVLLVVSVILALYLHMRQAANLSRRRAFVLASILPVLTVVAVYWNKHNNAGKDVNEIQAAELRIYPSELLLLPPMSRDAFFSNVKQLAAEADKKRDALPPSENAE